MSQDYIDRLEAECDRFNEDLPNLRSFILPGGTRASALLHVARTVTRRAERATWRAFGEYGDSMNPLTDPLPEPPVGPVVHPRAGGEPRRRRAVGAGGAVGERCALRPSCPFVAKVLSREMADSSTSRQPGRVIVTKVRDTIVTLRRRCAVSAGTRAPS